MPTSWLYSGMSLSMLRRQARIVWFSIGCPFLRSSLYYWLQEGAVRPLPAAVLLVIHGVHVLNEAQQLVGIAHFVVIPANDLDKGIRQGDTGLGVEDGDAGVTQEVRRHHSLVGSCRKLAPCALGDTANHRQASLAVLLYFTSI